MTMKIGWKCGRCEFCLPFNRCLPLFSHSSISFLFRSFLFSPSFYVNSFDSPAAPFVFVPVSRGTLARPESHATMASLRRTESLFFSIIEIVIDVLAGADINAGPVGEHCTLNSWWLRSIDVSLNVNKTRAVEKQFAGWIFVNEILIYMRSMQCLELLSQFYIRRCITWYWHLIILFVDGRAKVRFLPFELYVFTDALVDATWDSL